MKTPENSSLGRKGVYISAYWYDHKGAQGASFEQGVIFPNYWCLSPDAFACPDRLSTITLLFMLEAGLIADAVTRRAERPAILCHEKTGIPVKAVLPSYSICLTGGSTLVFACRSAA